MKHSLSFSFAAMLTLTSNMALCATTVCTDQTAFLSNVAAGAYTNGFSTAPVSSIYPKVLNPVIPVQLNYSQAGYSYSTYSISDADECRGNEKQALHADGDSDRRPTLFFGRLSPSE